MRLNKKQTRRKPLYMLYTDLIPETAAQCKFGLYLN